MRIRVFAFFIIILSTLTLTGCWDTYEISNHTIITLVGVDKVKDKIKLFLEYKPPHAQIPDNKDDSQKPSTVLIGEGRTLVEAKDSYFRKSSDDVYLGAIRAVVFSNSYAEDGIEEYLNRVRGTWEYRKTIDLFTTTAELERLFNSKALNTDNVGFDIDHMAAQLYKNRIDAKRTIVNIIEAMQVKNTGYLLSNLDIVEKKVVVNGLSVFKDNKKIGLIQANKMKGNNYIFLNKADGEYIVYFQGVPVTLSSTLDKRKIAVNYDNKNLTFDLNFSLKCEIINTSYKIKIDKVKMSELEEKISATVKEDISNAIKTSQSEYGCDYFYFYKYFRAKYNSDFKNINWNEKYKEAKFKIYVTAKVKPGNMIDFN